MGSLIGTRLGAYEVTDAIGAGGMGEVYRARDSRLNRDVALKVLPEAFARDTDRLARFKREAHVLASLNHPNIGAIYGLEEVDSPAPGAHAVRALVLELVEGPTLADVIARGPIPPADALPLARQIADALEAAHERGIIHRDLKPANIKLRPDGTVKVLDFGLATIHAPAKAGALADGEIPHYSEGPGFSRAITSPVMTVEGMVLGTAAYMSPEQAKGRPADKRSDVWAFGCVLFEMLTAKRPFDGEDVADTLAFVLTREPDWSALPAATPASVQRLLRRCLQKDRKKRLADIADARIEIEEAIAVPAADATLQGADAGAMSDRTSRRRQLAIAAAGVLVGAALTAAIVVGWNQTRVVTSPAAVRFDVSSPDQSVIARTPNSIAVSPDGAQLAFVSGENRTDFRIWTRAANAFTARLVNGSEQGGNPVWSPDGTSLVYTVGVVAGGAGRIRKVDLAGGPPLTIAPAGIPGAWSRDGTILFTGMDRRIHRVADTGGDATAVTALDPAAAEARHVARFWLPDGRRFAFLVENMAGSQAALYIGSVDSEARTKILDSAVGAAYTDGHLVYLREGTLFVQPFDPVAARTTGMPVPVLENVATFGVSHNGLLAYRLSDASTARGLSWVSLDGKPEQQLAIENVSTSKPRLSPDGRQLAFTRTIEGEKRDVWLLDLERNVPTRLTFDESSSGHVWSPDGTRLVYQSFRDGPGNLYVRDLKSNADELIVNSPVPKVPNAWSPDGTTLLFNQSPQGMPEIWGVRMSGDRTPFPVVKTGYAAGYAAFSPDGKWFAYCEGDSGPDQVYAQTYPPSGTRLRISTTSGAAPQWSADGKQILYTTTDDEVMIVDVTPQGNTLRIGTPRQIVRTLATFIHRGVLLDGARSRILLRDLAEEAKRPTIEVVVNWLEEVKAARARANATR